MLSSSSSQSSDLKEMLDILTRLLTNTTSVASSSSSLDNNNVLDNIESTVFDMSVEGILRVLNSEQKDHHPEPDTFRLLNGFNILLNPSNFLTSSLSSSRLVSVLAIIAAACKNNPRNQRRSVRLLVDFISSDEMDKYVNSSTSSLPLLDSLLSICSNCVYEPVFISTLQEVKSQKFMDVLSRLINTHIIINDKTITTSSSLPKISLCHFFLFIHGLLVSSPPEDGIDGSPTVIFSKLLSLTLDTCVTLCCDICLQNPTNISSAQVSASLALLEIIMSRTDIRLSQSCASACFSSIAHLFTTTLPMFNICSGSNGTNYQTLIQILSICHNSICKMAPLANVADIEHTSDLLVHEVFNLLSCATNVYSPTSNFSSSNDRSHPGLSKFISMECSSKFQQKELIAKTTCLLSKISSRSPRSFASTILSYGNGDTTMFVLSKLAMKLFNASYQKCIDLSSPDSDSYCIDDISNDDHDDDDFVNKWVFSVSTRNALAQLLVALFDFKESSSPHIEVSLKLVSSLVIAVKWFSAEFQGNHKWINDEEMNVLGNIALAIGNLTKDGEGIQHVGFL